MSTPLWHTEIAELHDFFTRWLGGELPDTDEAFARFEEVTAPSFALISPAGALVERAALAASLRAGNGSRPGLRIWIEHPTLRRRDDPLTLVTYEEWQEEGGQITARLSSALFIDAVEAPNGLRWAHVHETWLPQGRR